MGFIRQMGRAHNEWPLGNGGTEGEKKSERKQTGNGRAITLQVSKKRKKKNITNKKKTKTFFSKPKFYSTAGKRSRHQDTTDKRGKIPHQESSPAR